ncbi:2-dehydro-3-deoxygalactonokinase [Caulobacter sp. RHG1]|uniref:2-dehydro-3-deoxygalactonokinase n=1 Tax=Caulobacter sp. (strain RHG1) TaxID=2545762 RepID=UPI0015535FF2|nr:2-dehydro-3-deoxygalactonokinase [Caulobacter sp. RHG1]NQE61859.1 2-dehydro-3-deoxygalactonokinase [Caulobacter sp. RHG1]
MGDLIVFGDWGTSRLRLSLFDGDAKLAETDGPGIGALTASPAETLLQALAPWRAEHDLKRVILCGMAGSRSGVIEAPYAECPADAAAWLVQAAELALDGLDIRVAPGLAGTAANGAPDVMRGEEAQIFGAMALRPDLAQGERWFVLPGTHSKWARVRDGRVLGFQTFLTGELFALLTERSSLLMGADRAENADESAAGFDQGLARAQEGHPIAALFEARSAQLRAGRSGAWAQGYLSGLLIGSEVAEALRGADTRAVTVIGAAALAARYSPALAAGSVVSETLSGEACVLAGLRLFAANRS